MATEPAAYALAHKKEKARCVPQHFLLYKVIGHRLNVTVTTEYAPKKIRASKEEASAVPRTVLCPANEMRPIGGRGRHLPGYIYIYIYIYNG